MKVTLITHSTVLIELHDHQLLFDYFGQGNLQLRKNKPLYIFNSHVHNDHYSDKIYDIEHPHKKYILSKDITPKDRSLMVGPHESLDVDDLHIETLFSTDQGVAFVVEVEDQKIYFAGDLNDWHWQVENKQDEEDNKWQNETYLNEINRIANHECDIAFVPVDGRLDEHYIDGLVQFDKLIEAKTICPIHYFGRYQISEQLKNEKLALKASLVYPDKDYFSFRG